MFVTGPGLLAPGLQPETVNWLSRCDKRDPYNYIRAVDAFIRRGKQNGWWQRVGDIMLHGSKTLQASLEGLKGFFRYDDMTITGTVSAEYRLGISVANNASFVNTNKLPSQLPLFATEKHSLGCLVTTQSPGPGSECGASGTGGAKNFAIRASQGFKDNVWLGCDTILCGAGVTVGFLMGVRTSSAGGFAMKNDVPTYFQSAVGTVSLSPFAIGKTNPSAVSSTNRILCTFVGGGDWSEQEAIALYNDLVIFTKEIGIFGDIQVEPEAMGEACFGNNAVNGIIPSTFRVMQIATPPTSNTADFDTYAFFPVTDVCTRPYKIGSKVVDPLPNNPVATVSASTSITVTTTAHGLLVGDAVTLADLTAGNGFTTDQLNRQQIVTEIVDANQYKVVPGGTANATGSIGGAVATATHLTIRNQDSAWTPSRSGGYHAFVWMNRGERAIDGGPIVSWSQKGNDLHPPLIRRTGLFNGVPCRTAYSTHRKAIGAFLVYVAKLCNYADRNEASDPLNQGYLDIAEAWDLTAADVLTWQTACDTKETLFNVGLVGFAVCYDKAILPPKTLADVPQFAVRGIGVDLEHVDFRTPELHYAALARAGQIAHAKGFTLGTLNHRVDTTVGARSGWSKESAVQIINDPNIDSVCINVEHNFEGNDVREHLDSQLDFFKDANGNVPIGKIMMGLTLGTGPNQVTLTEAEGAGLWIQEKGITNCNIRRAALSQGGHENRAANQLQIRYLPNLSTRAVTATQFADAWDRKVVVTAPRKTIITDMISGLIADGVWWKIDYLAILAGENETQSLTDIRGRLLGSVVNTPTFTANQGFAFNGTTQYLRTDFIPRAQGIHMAFDNQMLGVWERTNVASSGFAIGAIGTDINKDAVILNPRTSVGDNMSGRNNSFELSIGGSTTSVGSTFLVREPSGLVRIVRNGIIAGGATIPATGNLLSREIYVGAYNFAEVANGYRACHVPAVVIGSSMSADEYLAVHNRIHTALQAIGAI